MTISTVSLTNTFDDWRTITNQVVTFVNDLENINVRAASATANMAFSNSNSAYTQANTARSHANSAYGVANGAYDQANTARSHANAAFLAANTYYATTFTQANNAWLQANTARTQGNVAFTQGNTAFTQANDAYTQANTAWTQGNTAFTQANTAWTQGNTAFTQANTARTQGNTAFTQANTGWAQGNTAFTQANGAWTQANTGYTQANNGWSQANTARIHANSAFDQANTARLHANAAFLAANSANSYSATAGDLVGGSTGSVVYQSAADQTAFLAAGVSGQVLVTKGTAAAPVWKDIIPAGTVMLFVQTAAPTGWTKSTTYNDRALRIVSGAVGAGGTYAFSTAFAYRAFSGTTSATGVAGYTDFRTVTGTVGATTLSAAQMPAHRHLMFYPADLSSGGSGSFASRGASYGSNGSYTIALLNNEPTIVNTGIAGSSGAHDHSFSGGSHQHYFDAGAHSHSFSSAIDMTVQYVDAIIAVKDAY